MHPEQHFAAPFCPQASQNFGISTTLGDWRQIAPFSKLEKMGEGLLGEVVHLASEFSRSPRTATLPLLRRLASLCACAAEEAGRARLRSLHEVTSLYHALCALATGDSGNGDGSWHNR